MNWKGKRVIIIGAARQGTALARFLVGQGARVILNDNRPADALAAERAQLADLPVEWVLGEHPLSLLDGADYLCPSGGVPLTIPLIREAQQRGIPFTNDSQVFLEEALCPVVGITGSAGKTTTTTLVGRMAQAAAGQDSGIRRSFVGGNIGNPLITDLDSMQAADLAVMELSSFQLEIMTRSPQVAALLNITPNHLDRHKTMEAYTAAKLHILTHQTAENIAILGRDDPGAWQARAQVHGRLYSFGRRPLENGESGTFLREGHIWLQDQNGPRQVLPLSEIQLRGEHNSLNVLAACAIAGAAGLPDEALRGGVQGFTGVEHRLEFIRTWGGARWYNDSIATAPERAIAAINSFDEPLILLAGGRDKDLPWDEFAQLAAGRIDHLVLFGEAAGLIQAAFEKYPPRGTLDICPDLAAAVQAAAGRVSPGDIVLLSPGGTSFDEFIDFAERGRKFSQMVNQL